MTSSNALDIINIAKSYGKIKALENITFSVKKGEYFCVLGPTGAGKTTLLKIISGLLKPDKGKIFVFGNDATDLPPEVRNISYMPQGYALFHHMTIYENVSYSQWIKDVKSDKPIEALKLVGLEHRKNDYPYELSGGQQQRIALARVLASGSKILLLDEPLSALDAVLNIELREELRKMIKELGLTAIHVTHNTAEAMSVADRILVLRNGNIEQIGKPHEIYDMPSSIFTASFLSEINVIDGIIIGSGTGRFYIETKIGTFSILRERSFVKEGNVIVVYRPSDILVSRKATSEDNQFKAIINDIEFLGLITRLHLSINSWNIVADVWTSISDRYKAGEHVYVIFPPELGIIYKYPKEGLILEISGDQNP